MTSEASDRPTTDAAEPLFRFENVVKRFGKTTALDGVTFTAPTGSIVGLLGRNGAGKSTTMHCLMGLQRPTSGRISLFGHDPWEMPAAVKQRVGYMSERAVPFPWATVDDVIGLCAPRYPRWDTTLERELLGRFRIDRRRKLVSLSLGQQRAVGLLLAICPRPDLVLLDEPAANLDAVARREFLEQILDLVAQDGRTVVFSSHILSDVERLVDRVVVLQRGRILVERPIDDLKERMRRVRLIFDGAAPEALEVPGAVRLRRRGREVLATVDDYDESLPLLLQQATGARVDVQAVGLEELFIDLVGDGDGDGTSAPGDRGGSGGRQPPGGDGTWPPAPPTGRDRFGAGTLGGAP